MSAVTPVIEDVTTMTAPAIVLDAVVSVVDGFPLLAGVNLVVHEGEVVLVSGPNGAGKTSLLRLVAGLLPVTEGRAEVLGTDLAVAPRAHRGHVALVGQETGCYDDLSVTRNLALHARAAGLPSTQVERIMRLLELDDIASVPHGRLSTGQRRRCALAVGLARDARLLLLDEPHAGLDARARDVVDRAVRAAFNAGTTVLLVSHELDRARALAHREIQLAGGCVVTSF